MKNILKGLVIFGLVAIFGGCVSEPRIAHLDTQQVMQQFVRGKTTAKEIIKKYGNPTKRSLITLDQAKTIFYLQEDKLGNNLLKAFSKNGSNVPASKKIVGVETPKVTYWTYNDFTTHESTIFNNYKRSRKGAKLMLIFNSKYVLVDYKFQKYNNTVLIKTFKTR